MIFLSECPNLCRLQARHREHANLEIFRQLFVEHFTANDLHQLECGPMSRACDAFVALLPVSGASISFGHSCARDQQATAPSESRLRVPRPQSWHRLWETLLFQPEIDVSACPGFSPELLLSGRQREEHLRAHHIGRSSWRKTLLPAALRKCCGRSAVWTMHPRPGLQWQTLDY